MIDTQARNGSGDSTTVAVISPGEMGAQVGAALRDQALRVVTSLEGRSPGSRERALEAGIELLPSQDAVVQQADAIISVVPSRAALPVARSVAERLARSPRPLLFLDANSIGAQTAIEIGRVITEAGGRFVDGGIIGTASALRTRGKLYLSGDDADEVATLVSGAIKTEILGPRVGQASAFKVLYAGVTKTLSALGIELLAGAERLGVRDALLDKLRADHMETATLLSVRLAGLPPRSNRRSQEMAELSEELEGLGLTAAVPRAAQATLKLMADRYEARGRADLDTMEGVLTWWLAAAAESDAVTAHGQT